MTPQRHRTRGVYFVLFMFVAVFLIHKRTAHLSAQSAAAPGGFVESDSSTTVRPIPTPSQIATFMPSRGKFTFPAPYLHRRRSDYQRLGLRGRRRLREPGRLCLLAQHEQQRRQRHAADSADAFQIQGRRRALALRLQQEHGHGHADGAAFSADSAYAWATGEGWYFSATQPTVIYMNDGPRLLRYDVVSHAMSVVFDVTTFFGQNRVIWQFHSSNDDKVHSFTLKDGSSYADLGCGAYSEATGKFAFFPAQKEYDECQIDKSGRYLVIKETNGQYGSDNVVEDLQTGAEQVLTDQNGAGGHSDAGFGYEVAEDNWNQSPGAIRVWSWNNPTDGSQGRLVFRAPSWLTMDNHISHANAQPNWTLSQQYVCDSSATTGSMARANEVLCYRLDGSLTSLVVAPVMTDLNAAGGADYYSKLPKGNLDPTGNYMIWTTNMGGNRLDAVIVRIPLGQLPAPIDGQPVPGTGTPTTPTPPTTPPATSPADPGAGSAGAPGTGPATGTPVTWTSLVNATVRRTTLVKTGGCDGCPTPAPSRNSRSHRATATWK